MTDDAIMNERLPEQGHIVGLRFLKDVHAFL